MKQVNKHCESFEMDEPGETIEPIEIHESRESSESSELCKFSVPKKTTV